MVGDFPNLGEVWYNKDSIANILSLADVRRVCRVTMDTTSAPEMQVHRLDGSTMVFQEHPSGLYVFDAGTNVTNNTVTAYTMISTVADQKRMFSRRQVQAADAARELYRKLGRPSEAEFQTILRGNQIRNCPVTPDDARRALKIYGPDIAVLKGKTTRSSAAPRVPTFMATALPAAIVEHHRNITLCIDLFFVQGLAFFHTISRDIGFRTVSPIPDRKASTILREMKTVLNLYRYRGLVVRDVHADSEFEPLREPVRPTVLNVVPPDSHVGEVERSIRTIKERLRSCVHGLPFKRLPKLLITQMVSDVVRFLNQFPWQHGISDTLSPAAIVTGIGTPDFHNMRLEFGTYVQVFEDNSPSNTPKARSMGAIALNPTGNAQGDYYFMSLSTGAKISRHQWQALPITDTAIARVEAIALHEGQPLVQDTGLVVEWRPDQPIDDDEYDLDFVPPVDAVDDFAAHDFEPIDADELADLLADDTHQAPPDFDDGAAPAIFHAAHAAHEGAYEDPIVPHVDGDVLALEVDAGAQDEQNEDAFDEGAPDEGAQAEDVLDEGAQEEEQEEEVLDEEVLDDGAQEENEVAQGAIDRDDRIEHPYHLRQRGGRANRANFQTAMDTPHDGKSYYPPRQLVQMTADDQRHIIAHIMTQMTAKAGIAKH